ncbi:MAG TPA: IPT/TIG domain-containing protein [Thermoanaerobaculia bacterium]|nr:IPT/TIG domain-containing protein [Thermoanaerobaculia bacterium]
MISHVRTSVLAVCLCVAGFAQEPRIESVTPSRGPIAGGNVITIRGENLGAASVTIDRQPVAHESRTDTEIRLRMPAHDNGFAALALRSANAVAYGEYLYVPPALRDLPAGFITTVAGIGAYTRVHGPALSANVGTGPLAFDAAGNVLIADTGANRIYRLRPDGSIEIFAGNGLAGSDGDGGLAIDARVDYPRGIAFDGAGNAYFGGDRCELRRVRPDGIIETVAGDGTCGFSGDGGLAKNARIASPTWIVADDEDVFFVDFTYVVEPGSGGPRDSVRIRRIHLGDGRISTFAGNGAVGFSGDGGPATQASFDFGIRSIDAGALALDPQGNVYIADAGNGRIRKIDRNSGIINTFHVPAEGEVNWLTFDAAGNLYYAAGKRIVKLSAQGEVLQSWGTAGQAAFVPDGAAAATSVLSAGPILVHENNDILYVDGAIGRLRRINAATGLIESVAGIGPALLGENGPAIETVLANTSGEGIDLAFAPRGELLIGDAPSFRLRSLRADGNLVTIGGTGGFFGSREEGVPATSVSMYPIGISIDAAGAIDITNRSDLFRIEPDGLLYRNSHPDVSACILEGDGGPMRQARVCQPMDVLRDSNGDLYIADTNNNRARRVEAGTNVVSTIAGNGGPVSGFERYGFGSYCGDGGRAFDACLNAPWGIELDDAGNLFISEIGRIRKVGADGIISTFVEKHGISKLLFRGGYLYSGIERFARDGTATQLAGGNPQNALLGDGGPALNARTAATGTAVGVAIDAEGNYFFADVGHRRIRAIRYGAVLAPPGARIEGVREGSIVRVRVRDAENRIAPSVRVELSVPTSGATCRLSSTFAVTGDDGVAVVSCDPGCVAGSYDVTVRPVNGTAVAAIPATNAGFPCRRRAVRH